jgi:sensor c-di-GMP phosphodiesterase-like protein
MKRTLKQRVLITMVATMVAAACGFLAAYWIGREIALRLTASKLSGEAVLALDESAEFSRDAHAAVVAMNNARNPDCSSEDLQFLHNILYRSYLLKEIGRLHGNRIACSTTLEHMHSAAELPKPDSIGNDGVKVYRDPPGFRLPDAPVTILQDGDTYVVLNMQINNLRNHAPVRILTTVIGPVQNQPEAPAGSSAQPTRLQLTSNGDFRVGQILYSTRCSTLSIDSVCLTASLPVPEALQDNNGERKALLALGGPAGGLFGFVVALFYRRNRNLDHQLRRAIRKDTMRVEYQQIVSLASGRIMGAEALARWTDEEGFAVGPDIFVKIAEEHGFVDSITRLVVRHVLHDFAATLRARPDFRVSINVAATDLADPQFLPMLEYALKQAGVSARSVVIEITENSTARYEVAIAAILRLRQRGHSVHIDDFGTGYSSLSYLHELSVDAIKIDRSFTRSIGTEAVIAAILPQILPMAKTLHLQVIVEGIETRQQAVYFAATAQPILGQGWLFGRAVTADAFHSLLAEEENREQAATTKLEPACPISSAP